MPDSSTERPAGAHPATPHSIALQTMATTVPTVTDVLYQTDIGSCRHRWRVEGGTITITRDKLRPALEAAYDPFMPDWPAMVELADA